MHQRFLFSRPVAFFPFQDKVAKVRLIHRIQARRKLLKFLRIKDKEKFDWLLKELKIKFVPHRDYEKEEYWKYKKPTKASRRISAAVVVKFMTCFTSYGFLESQ